MPLPLSNIHSFPSRIPSESLRTRLQIPAELRHHLVGVRGGPSRCLEVSDEVLHVGGSRRGRGSAPPVGHLELPVERLEGRLLLRSGSLCGRAQSETQRIR